MAEPEDPQTDAPQPHDDFDDDLVGFASPRALSGMPLQRPVASTVAPEPQPVPETAPEPIPSPEPGSTASDYVEPEPEPDPDPDPGFVVPAVEPKSAPLSPPPVGPPTPEVDADSSVEAEVTADDSGAMSRSDATTGMAAPSTAEPVDLSPRPEAAPVPVVADDDFGRAGATRTFERPAGRHDPGVTAEGDARLSLVIYSCLIAAAFSLGTTAVVALFLAWTGRLLVKGWTRSHLLYQMRTSLIGVIAGVVGVLTFPLGVGVFILSLAVIWVVARGTAGLIKLLRREEIRDPQTWSLP